MTEDMISGCIKVEQNHNYPKLMKFYSFFVGLPSDYLKGIHALDSDKYAQYCHVTDLQKAEEIYRSYALKNKFLSKKNWRFDQIALLIYLADKGCLKSNTSIYGLNSQIWESIAELIPGRNTQNCKEKLYSLNPSKLNQTPWSQEEDQLLLQLIEKYGINQWKTISLKLVEKNPIKIYRSGKQCRQHYACFLKPDLKKGPWSEQQDYQLLCLFLKYGRKWAQLSQELPGRNENSIKNRFSLLFENKNAITKQFPSQIVRKVKKKKQILEKKLMKDVQQIEQQEKINLEENNGSEIGSNNGGLEKVENEPLTNLEKKELELDVEYEKYFAF